jgi:cell division protein FtsX
MWCNFNQCFIGVSGFVLSLVIQFAWNCIVVVMRLSLQNWLGATNGFVRRPFLYSGFWIGFFFRYYCLVYCDRRHACFEAPSLKNYHRFIIVAFILLFMSLFETIVLIFVSSLLGIAGSCGWL